MNRKISRRQFIELCGVIALVPVVAKLPEIHPDTSLFTEPTPWPSHKPDLSWMDELYNDGKGRTYVDNVSVWKGDFTTAEFNAFNAYLRDNPAVFGGGWN